MIPFFELKFDLGPLHLQGFGLFVLFGCFGGDWLMQWHGKRVGLPTKVIQDAAVWALGTGLFTGHWVHLFLYHPEDMAKSAWQPLKFWDGLSSLGGVAGGVAAIAIFFAVKKLPIWRYGDSITLGLAPGWAVARIGCFVVHDHPGLLTRFPLAVAFPAGPRYDLGLFDALLLFALTGVLWFLHKRGRLEGQLIGLLALCYGVGRFAEDFLRASDLPYHDARYLGLTPAQYFCFALVAFGVYRLVTKPVLAALPAPEGPQTSATAP